MTADGLSCGCFTPKLGWGLHRHWHQHGGVPCVWRGAGSGRGTCSSSFSLPTTAALPQSMASAKGSSQPSLSSTGMQAACDRTPHRLGQSPWTLRSGVPHPPAHPVPAEPPGSEMSPSACPGAQCRRWSCAAAPGSRTWDGRGDRDQAQPSLSPRSISGVLLPPSKAEHPSQGTWGQPRAALALVRAGVGSKQPWLQRASRAEMLWVMEGGACGQKENL